MLRYLLLTLYIFISCSRDKYDYIKEGQRFNKNTGEVEYKIKDKWVDEKDYKKIKSAINDEVKEVSASDFIDKLGVMYYKDQKEPFTGKFLVREDDKTLTGIFNNGERVGTWIWMHENGSRLGEQTYKDGSPDGVHTEWYENGQKKSEITYAYQTGWTPISEKYWNEDGSEGEPRTSIIKKK